MSEERISKWRATLAAVLRAVATVVAPPWGPALAALAAAIALASCVGAGGTGAAAAGGAAAVDRFCASWCSNRGSACLPEALVAIRPD